MLSTRLAHGLPLAALLLASPALAQTAETDPTLAPSGTYVLDTEHTTLTWRVSHFGLSHYTARSNEMQATLEWNAEDPAASTLTASVEPSSVDTPYQGEVDFDAEIANDFLNAEENPEISFTSTAVEITGDTTGTVTGDLTFNGQTMPLTLDVTFNGAYASAPMAEVPKLGFSATGTVDRTAYGADQFAPAIGADVELLIQAEFMPQGQ